MCDVQFVYVFDNGKIDYNECVQYNINENCLAVIKNQPTKCKYCKKGFTLNSQLNICESYKPSKCTSSDHFNSLIFFTSTIVSYALYYSQNGLGCSQCIKGFTSVYNDTKKISCTYSDSLMKFTENYSDNSHLSE